MRQDEARYVAARSAQAADRAGLGRRDVLRLGASLSLAAGVARVAGPSAAQAAPGRSTAATATAGAPVASPIVKPLPPEWFVKLGTNAEMRWDTVGELGYRIPNERFFVRDHTATPIIDERSWRLGVSGSGLDGPGIELTYDDLRRMPQREVLTAIECAGNGRSFFGLQQNTPAPGTQWGLGAIGVARWRGVPLRAVLERAGLSARAVDVMPSGLDGTVVSGGIDYGHVRRPMPVEKALDDVILALTMNGEELPPDHGFPVRLVVPGWIGVASIKWVGHLEVSDEPLFSYWNTQQYVMTGPAYPDRPLVTEQTVKSAWELPWNATLPAGEPLTLTGRSWSGTSRIERVDVSIDAGQTWTSARLHGPGGGGTWTRWRVSLAGQPAGPAQLWARATDADGRTQPATVPFNTNGYLFGAIVRHPVQVA
jgi:DMSO/TMAO reductase YedYZ molybdopterin-dependent catalytic subunit